MLTGVKDRLTVADLAREPRSLAVVAYFDGYMRAAYPNAPREHRQWYPRPLNRREERAWREGFTEGQSERRRHDAHGFRTCESVNCEGTHP